MPGSVRARISRPFAHRSRAASSRARSPSAARSTPARRTDARFHDLNSVRQHAIAAVLCVPIGGDPTIGALYLQGAHGAPGFTKTHRERIEDLCVLLGVLVNRLIERSRPSVSLAEERDRRILQSLTRNRWNVTEVARELGVSRALIYRSLPRLRRAKSGV